MGIKLTQEEKEILKKYKNLINDRDYMLLSKKLATRGYVIRKNIFAYIMECGIPVLKYMDNIPESLFQGAELLTLTIPENIFFIGKYAFSNSHLRKVIMKDGIDYIDTGAFLNCDKLSTVELPNTLRRIGPEAFRGCTSLKEIFIPDSVTDIGAAAFAGCDNLTIKANFRKKRRDKLRCKESDIEWFKQHIVWIKVPEDEEESE